MDSKILFQYRYHYTKYIRGNWAGLNLIFKFDRLFFQNYKFGTFLIVTYVDLSR
jgi:hypothetical protein